MQQKVYVVLEEVEWESFPRLIAIFATKEGAQKEVNAQNKGYLRCPFSYEEYELFN